MVLWDAFFRNVVCRMKKCGVVFCGGRRFWRGLRREGGVVEGTRDFKGRGEVMCG
jgi:hypothetical protein